MSGEPVVLPGSFERFILAAGRLAGGGLDPMAVIGGVAVAIRTAQAVRDSRGSFSTRATLDVDAAVLTGGSRSIEDRLVAAGVAVRDDGRTTIEGVKIETIAIPDTFDDDLGGLPPKEVLFLESHRYAVGSAETLRVTAGGVAAALPVARPAALVAMKLHAAQDRRSERPEKLASDVLDIHNLLTAFDPDRAIGVELAAHPRLADAVAAGARTILIAQVQRSVRALVAWGPRDARAITRARLEDLGAGLIAGLGHDVTP